MEHRQQIWKLDLWGYGPQHYEAQIKQDKQLHAQLARADRAAILRIKDVVCHDQRYRYAVTSVQIYRAVATAGVTTVDQFWAWWRDQHGETAAP